MDTLILTDLLCDVLLLDSQFGIQAEIMIINFGGGRRRTVHASAARTTERRAGMAVAERECKSNTS